LVQLDKIERRSWGANVAWEHLANLMVRSAKRVSNHEAPVRALIPRDAAKTPLLRMR
jgi:hypothetical protein